MSGAITAETPSQTAPRRLFLEVAEAAVALLAADEVARRWDEPSALSGFSVRGLAGHLAGQIFFPDVMLAAPIPEEPVVPLAEHFARVNWVGSDLETPFNRMIRASGEQDAAEGPARLAESAARCVAKLHATLRTAPDRPVRRDTWGPWSISFDDYLTSRVLELVIHSDDLACSVGLPAPGFPAEAVETVVDILTRIALRRHGATAVLRALSRSERAPESISAL